MISDNMKEVTVSEGSVAILDCSVTASPMPTVSWYKGDNPLMVGWPFYFCDKHLEPGC